MKGLRIRRPPVRIGPGVPIISRAYKVQLVSPFSLCETLCEKKFQNVHLKRPSPVSQIRQSNVNKVQLLFCFHVREGVESNQSEHLPAQAKKHRNDEAHPSRPRFAKPPALAVKQSERFTSSIICATSSEFGKHFAVITNSVCPLA